MYVLQEILDAMLMADTPQRMIGLQFYGPAIYDTKNDYRFMVILGALAGENQRGSPLEIRFTPHDLKTDKQWMQCLGWARTAASWAGVTQNDRTSHLLLYSGDINYAFMIADSRRKIVDCYSGNPF